MDPLAATLASLCRDVLAALKNEERLTGSLQVASLGRVVVMATACN